MNRHLLAASDGSAHSHRALEYAAELYRNVDDIDITIITVAQPVPRYLQAGFSTGAGELNRLGLIDDFLSTRESECRKILEAGVGCLIRSGFPEERIRTKEIVRSKGIAHDILFEARIGKYDAILAGTRGISNVSAFLTGSVSKDLVKYGKNIPVWLVADKSKDPCNVLIAVDACQECLRVLDHAAFALAGVTRAQITVFHVIPRFRPFISSEEKMKFDEIERFVTKTAEKEVKDLLSETKDIFSAAGLDSENVEIRIKQGTTGVASDILHEYKHGGYGTLISGRRGIGGWEALIPGSVSDRLINSIDRGAIWIVE